MTARTLALAATIALLTATAPAQAGITAVFGGLKTTTVPSTASAPAEAPAPVAPVVVAPR